MVGRTAPDGSVPGEEPAWSAVPRAGDGSVPGWGPGLGRPGCALGVAACRLRQARVGCGTRRGWQRTLSRAGRWTPAGSGPVARAEAGARVEAAVALAAAGPGGPPGRRSPAPGGGDGSDRSSGPRPEVRGGSGAVARSRVCGAGAGGRLGRCPGPAGASWPAIPACAGLAAKTPAGHRGPPGARRGAFRGPAAPVATGPGARWLPPDPAPGRGRRAAVSGRVEPGIRRPPGSDAVSSRVRPGNLIGDGATRHASASPDMPGLTVLHIRIAHGASVSFYAADIARSGIFPRPGLTLPSLAQPGILGRRPCASACLRCPAQR